MKKLLWLVLTCGLWANDSSYTLSGNQLIPVFESNISITKEILTIKRKKNNILDVKVEYTFFNPAHAKGILVGFEAMAPSGDVVGKPKRGQHPYMKNFTIFLNTKKLSYKVATYTSTYIKGKKIVSEDVIQLVNSPDFNIEESGIGYVYYFNAKFKKGENKLIHHYRYETSGSALTHFKIDYVLTAAKRWANKQIDDFTLLLDMGDYTDFFVEKSFFINNADWAVDGVIRNKTYNLGGVDTLEGILIYLHQGVAVFHKKNFQLDGDLSLFGGAVFLGVRDNNDDYNYHKDIFDARKHKLPFTQEYLSVNSYVAKDKLSDKILRNLPYARRGYAFQDKRIQKYYEALEWYRKRPAYKAKKSDWTEKEKEFNLLMQKQKLHILRNLPYARRGHAFKNERLKSFFEAQPWYHKNEYKADGTLELSPTEKKWLKKIKSMHKEDTIAFYALMDEHEKIFTDHSVYLTYLAENCYPLSNDTVVKVKDVNASMFQGSYHFGESEGESTITILWNHGKFYVNEETAIWDKSSNGWKLQDKRFEATFKNGKLVIEGTHYELYQSVKNNQYLDIKKGDLFLLSKYSYYLNGKTHFNTQLNPQRKLVLDGIYPEVHFVKLTEADLSGYQIQELTTMLKEAQRQNAAVSSSESEPLSGIEIHNIELLRMELASWYHLEGKQDKAIALYKKVLIAHPENDDALFRLGGAYKSAKKYDKAIATYKKAIRINPISKYAWHYIGDCYRENKAYKKAIESYKKVLKVDSEYADNYYTMGLTYHDMHKYDKAIDSYKKALAINPTHCSLFHLGRTYGLKKEYQNSIFAYKKAIENSCWEQASYNNIGVAYASMKDYVKAIESYTKALKINPEDVLANNNIGSAYEKIKEYDKAIEFYEIALKLNPKYEAAYRNMTIVYKNKKDYINAFISIQRAKKINSKYKKIIFSQAMNKKALHILRNLPYAKRGYVFKGSDLKTFFDSQMWYIKNDKYIAKTSDLSKKEKKWLERIKALSMKGQVALFELMDEYEALKLADEYLKNVPEIVAFPKGMKKETIGNKVMYDGIRESSHAISH